MIKKIIQIADIHIRNVIRHEEYEEELGLLVSKCAEIASHYEKDEVRIALCGDIVHQKNTISNELFIITSSFIRQLENIAKVIVISGNHDLVEQNKTRKDTLTALFETADFKNSYFLDKMLDYKSGTIKDDNVTWALYSIHDGWNRPDIEQARIDDKDNIVIGLFHGTIIGTALFNGYASEAGISAEIFKGCDIVMAGHIHKMQEIDCEEVKIVYSGSPIQQDEGETVTQHGFMVWDLEKKAHEFIELPTTYGIYKFMIKSEDDIDNDKEELLNY
jgi:DNA repair exonuclease SbcCD nuclease subunit